MANPKSPRRRPRRAAENLPLDLDALVAREAEIPAEVRARPSTPRGAERRLVVSALDGRPVTAPRMRELDDAPGTFDLGSRRSVVPGAIGRSAARLPLDAAPARRSAGTEPHLPDDVARSFLPRVTAPWAPRLMRSPSGKPRVPEKVYPPDDRITFWPSGYPWHCAGKIFTWTDPSASSWQWTGSGVLVGPRHVLTAGHVCPWGASPWQMLFVPGSYDGSPVPGVDSYVSDYRGWDTDDQVTAWDMAILRLYDPLGDQLGWFGAKVYDASWQGSAVWSLIGWPGAVGGGQRPTWTSPIATIDDDPDGDAVEIEHLGDSSPGNSGGPLFGTWPDGFPYVIGAHSGADVDRSEDNNVAAGGRAMVDLIIWAHQNWP